MGRWVELFAEESGNPVALVARRIRVVAPRPAVEISGAIQAFSATSWTLSRTVVAVDANTAINGEPQTGLVAHGVADLLSDNTLKARRLSVEWREPNGPRPDIAFNGTVEQLPAQGLEGQWRVSGRTVNVTAATAIDQSKGPVEVGAQVRVVGRQEPNQVQALRITVLDCATHPCPPMILLRGRIQSLPPTGLLGVWTIDGQRVRVNQRTRLVNGQNAHIGAPVELGAFQPPQGAPIALWLRVHAGGSPIVEITRGAGSRIAVSDGGRLQVAGGRTLATCNLQPATCNLKPARRRALNANLVAFRAGSPGPRASPPSPRCVGAIPHAAPAVRCPPRFS